MLVAARPILTSQRTGPMQGKLVFGQLLDEAKIAEFAKQTELSIAIHLLNSTELPSDFAAARASLLSSNPPEVVYTMQNQTAEGYSLLYDINGKPVMIMEIGMPNAIYQQGQQTVFYFAVALLIAGLTFSAVVMWLLERIVMGRLGYLNKRVQEIASSNQLSERIFMEGTDELSSLANTINNSLAITENSRIELQQLNSLLEEKVNDLNTMQTYRDHFFTNAAHEFRTPMAILRTQLYLAEKQPTLWQKHIDILSSATNQLSDILTDVFDMAQFKRQSGTLYRQEFEFKSLVAKIIAEERQYVYQKGIKLATELPDYNVYIQGDQGALENALEKLMHFIINYSAKDSQINVILATKSTVDSGFLELECSSLGLLLSASDLPHIFLPFYKPSEGNIRNTGLQLSVAKEIIDLHKGQISAYEDSQKGICFNIQLLVKRTSNELIAT